MELAGSINRIWPSSEFVVTKTCQLSRLVLASIVTSALGGTSNCTKNPLPGIHWPVNTGGGTTVVRTWALAAESLLLAAFGSPVVALLDATLVSVPLLGAVTVTIKLVAAELARL